MYRKYPLVNGEIYHVMNKSIAGFRIFNHHNDYERMLRLMRYFSLREQPSKFSFFLTKSPFVKSKGFEAAIVELNKSYGKQVQIIAYCLMPTHFHMLVKQTEDSGISEFLRMTQNAYARYFNVKYKRQGTLWMSRFKNVLVESDEQALHTTRYLHLNPTSAGLVKKPEEWAYSSYDEYINPAHVIYPITDHKEIVDMAGDEYKEFTEDHQGYQRSLEIIKSQVLE